MERELLIETVKNFLTEEFEADRDAIVDCANMRQTLALDSLDYIDMVVIIESHFGVKLGEADFRKITTFSDFYDVIEAKIANKVMA